MTTRRRAACVRLVRLAPLVVAVGLLVAWHGFVAARDVPSVVLPGPLEVAAAFGATWPTLLADAVVTAVTAGLGLALGTVVGLALAFGMVRSRLVRSVSLPYVVGLRIAPVIAIAPLVFLWLGRGIVPRAVVVASLTQFPIAIGTLSGLRSVPESVLDVCRSVGASSRQLFVHVRLPAAASSLLASLRIAAALAVVGAVVAEFVTLRSGLGYRIYDEGLRLQTAEMYAALSVLAVVGVAFYHLPTVARRFDRRRLRRSLRRLDPRQRDDRRSDRRGNDRGPAIARPGTPPRKRGRSGDVIGRSDRPVVPAEPPLGQRHEAVEGEPLDDEND